MLKTSAWSGSFVLSVALLAPGCGSSSAPRSISGALSLGDYPLDRAVVIAQSADHRTFVAPVSATGRFRLAVPAGATYRLLIANTTPAGAYRTISRIAWATRTSTGHWAKLSAGAPIALGTIHLAGSARPAPSSGLTSASAQADGNDNVDENDQVDDVCGEQGEHAGDHQNDDGACGTEHNDAVICGAQDVSDSASDDVNQEGEFTVGDDGEQGANEVDNETSTSCDDNSQAGNDGHGAVAGELAAVAP